MLSLIVVSFLVLLVAVIVAVRRYSKKRGCSNPKCHRGGWWRVFLIVRDDYGEALAKMPTPFRLCGRCYSDLDPRTAVPERVLRKKIAKALIKRHGRRPDWGRISLKREHAMPAWLRRIGK